MRYGFVLDQRKCIGCHACTVACKAENGVPLGAFRTWVKYIEKGEFPNTSRYFAVLRCNHCDDAPCIAICPTKALFRRPDGIVDFDPARCIGCKSCMQACPYDALYIDPNSQTAAKCNFCAHRVEVNLKPACEIVCPVQAIISGDLDDPQSQVARLVTQQQVQVRKPEQGTKPKVFYVGADAGVLTPQVMEPAATYMWAERPKEELPLVPPGPVAQKPVDALARVVYDVPHMPRPWGWKVSAYLWTKSIAAGVLLLAGAFEGLGWGGPAALLGIGGPILALAFLAVTGLLLIGDLKRPDRFHYILLKPNPTSWLVWGAWILMAFGAAGTLWLAAGLAGAPGVHRALAWPLVVLAAAAAGYSALLFGQAEGRDFWQSPLLFWHLLVAAVLAGAASLLLLGTVLGSPAVTLGRITHLLLAALPASGLVLGAELFSPHPNLDARQAARLIVAGPFRGWFWGAVVGLGIAASFLLLLAGGTGTGPLAGILALAGLWVYEDLWIRAGQAIPLS